LPLFAATVPTHYASAHPTSSRFLFNDPAPTELSTLSLHDALPIWCTPAIGGTGRPPARSPSASAASAPRSTPGNGVAAAVCRSRSEEHTSELQSRSDLVCRLLLEKKNTNITATSERQPTRRNTCSA